MSSNREILDFIWETVQNDLSALDAAVSDFIQGKI